MASHSESPGHDDHSRELWLRHRERAEHLWAVSVDRSTLRRAGVRGALSAPVQAMLAPLVRWYVRPLVDAQREFNDVTLKLVDTMEETLRTGIDSRLLEELEERVYAIERVRRTSTPLAGAGADSASAAAAPPGLDYIAFEARMRGARAEIAERQRHYVDEFRASAPVLDIGCGRGEFLVLLRDAGIEATGVDLNRDMVDLCRAEGLTVEHGDGLVHLQALADGSLGGIFAAQVVEHLRPVELAQLFGLAATKIRAGGTLVLETVNPLSFIALKGYFADLTHVQPLVSETLVLLARQAGFRRTHVTFLNEPEQAERLVPVELPDHPELDAARIALARNVSRLNDVLFGPQDYALIARR